MINLPKAKLFEEKLSIFGRDYSLAVFLMFNANKTNYYRCLIDDIKCIDLWINDEGHWIDMQAGRSELCDTIGELIESKLLPGQKKTA